jgi:hypothetical protein
MFVHINNEHCIGKREQFFESLLNNVLQAIATATATVVVSTVYVRVVVSKETTK